jgi:flagellar biosynthesis anti-sigma factor FlgM
MRVDNNLANPIGGGTSVGSLGQAVAPARSPAQDLDDRAADSVRLSHASHLVALARNAQPADRQARIASLAEQVRSGTYQVDAKAVSQALINNLK